MSSGVAIAIGSGEKTIRRLGGALCLTALLLTYVMYAGFALEYGTGYAASLDGMTALILLGYGIAFALGFGVLGWAILRVAKLSSVSAYGAMGALLAAGAFMSLSRDSTWLATWMMAGAVAGMTFHTAYYGVTPNVRRAIAERYFLFGLLGMAAVPAVAFFVMQSGHMIASRQTLEVMRLNGFVGAPVSAWHWPAAAANLAAVLLVAVGPLVSLRWYRESRSLRYLMLGAALTAAAGLLALVYARTVHWEIV